MPDFGGDGRRDREEPDIIADGDPHDVAIWERHPDVRAVAPESYVDGADRPQVRLSLWLTDAGKAVKPEPSETRWPAVTRKPDLEFGGDGTVHATFWSRFPDLERLEMYEEMPGGEAPFGWWAVRLWLSVKGAAPNNLGVD